MNDIKNENYVVIQGFMVNELRLKGTELFVYAIIYGFSQDGDNYFTGSRNYLAKWCNVSLPTVDKALTDLCDKEYIIKEQQIVNGVIFNRYKISLGVVKKLYRGGKKTLHNNIEYNIENNNNIKKENIIKEKFFDDDEVNKIFIEFLELRKTIKAKNTDRAIKVLVNKLNKYDDATKYKMIEKSIVNSWKDVYELKEKKETFNEMLERKMKEDD